MTTAKPENLDRPDWTTGPARTAAAWALALLGGIALLGAWRSTPASRAGATPAASAIESAAASGRVELNAATAQELEALPGIGATLARRIVDDRERKGAFRNVDELDRVSGIGPVTLERLRPYLRVE
ncbi:MAG: ComEA family DNA-binding protein [Phycisphaerales bacterium]